MANPLDEFAIVGQHASEVFACPVVESHEDLEVFGERHVGEGRGFWEGDQVVVSMSAKVFLRL